MNFYYRKIIASSELFSGFEVIIDIRYFDTMDQIIKHFHKKLLSLFEDHKLDILRSECAQCKFHCHTHTFDEILMNLDQRDIYLCDHC